MKSIDTVLEENRDRLLQLDGVFGVSRGGSKEGPHIEIQAANLSDDAREHIPTELDGFPVKVRIMDSPELF